MSNAEEINSRVPPHKANEHFRQSLKGAPLYYRVGLNSGFRRADTTPMDAVFDVSQVFPNQRADLMSGEWQVFVESFEGKLDSQIARTNIKLCLPDLVRSSQDYVMTAEGVCRSSDAVAHIPITQEYRRPDDGADTTEGDGTYDELGPLPITVSNVIEADSIGVKVDPMMLFSGQVRVLLRNEHHDRLDKAGGTPIPDTEGWRATLLFVHSE